jgi:ADP-heptose:LPS heptosyltransferase
VDILVINLMRLGDLIQTTPVLRCLRAHYPGGRVTLAIKDVFREPARLLPGVDRLLEFPSINLAMLLDQEGGWPEAAQRLENWLRESFPRPPDLVINLTPNALGGVLALATGGQETRGMAAYRSWEFGTRPDWASYALVVSRARQANPFNLVDLFLREGGLAPDGRGVEVAVPPAAKAEAGAFCENLMLSADTKLVGLFPGASQPERCWPTERFAKTARLLMKNRACHFLLLGSAKETALGEAIAREMPPGATTSLLGRTSPAALAAYLQRLDLLITNDTGPMHLAAAVGTPTLALFLASARVQDTGPVGRGHVIIEPRLDCHPCLAPCPQPRCHQAITPEAVYFWAEKLLNMESLMPVEETPDQGSVRAYLSSTDPQGYHAYLPLIRRPLGPRDFWLWVHRLVWGQVLDGATFSPAPLEKWLEVMLRRHYLPPRGDPGFVSGISSLEDLCQSAGQGEKLAEEILDLAGNEPTATVRLLQKIESLGSVDRSLQRISVAFPELAALVDFFFLDQRDKQGSEVMLLGQELKAAYARLRRLGELALERLTELGGTLSLPDKSGGMAQSVQHLLSNKKALPPESEGASCR